MARFCGKCGSGLEAAAKFCPKCGQPVAGQAVHTAGVAVPAAVGASRRKGFWLLFAGSLLYWWSAQNDWAEYRSSLYAGGITTYGGFSTSGTDYMLLGGFVAFLMLVGTTVWLALARWKPDLGSRRIPPPPHWWPVVLLAYCAVGIAKYIVAYTEMSKFDTFGPYGSGYTTDSGAWILALIAMPVLAAGAVRYWRGRPYAASPA